MTKFDLKTCNRRDFLKTVAIGAGALAIPNTFIVRPAQANPALVGVVRTLLPMFGRLFTRGAARATSRQALKRTGLTFGGVLGTASTAWAAHDVYGIYKEYSDPVQETVEYYQPQDESAYAATPREQLIEMIWNANEPNEYFVNVINNSDRFIRDEVVVVIYDLNKQKDIALIELEGAMSLPPHSHLSGLGVPIKLPDFLKAGDRIQLFLYLKNSTDAVAIDESHAIVVERA